MEITELRAPASESSETAALETEPIEGAPLDLTPEPLPDAESLPSNAPSEAVVSETASESANPESGTLTELTAEEILDRPTPSLPVNEVTQASADFRLRAVIEAIVYLTEEPVSVEQLATAIDQPKERVLEFLNEISTEFSKPHHGVNVQVVAGGYKMATKPEHHDAVRAFVKSLKPPLKLSLPALETLAVIAYKQPITAPEIMEIRGVQGAGVIKTLLDRKLIGTAGRKNVIGKPILYKTTREFLLQFGLKDVSELPSLKEFDELRRMALPEADPAQDTAPEVLVAPAQPALGEFSVESIDPARGTEATPVERAEIASPPTAVPRIDQELPHPAAALPEPDKES